MSKEKPKKSPREILETAVSIDLGKIDKKNRKAILLGAAGVGAAAFVIYEAQKRLRNPEGNDVVLGGGDRNDEDLLVTAVELDKRSNNKDTLAIAVPRDEVAAERLLGDHRIHVMHGSEAHRLSEDDLETADMYLDGVGRLQKWVRHWMPFMAENPGLAQDEHLLDEKQ